MTKPFWQPYHGDIHFGKEVEEELRQCNPQLWQITKTAALESNTRTMRFVFDAMQDAARKANVYFPAEVARYWENFAGKTDWSKALREFGELGGAIKWHGGYPRSKSAIPLCFTLYTPDGEKIPGRSRLKDIHAAIDALQRR